MNDANITGLWGAATQFGQDALNIGMYYENRNWQAKREDTAVQRRVADMRAAGINPILAAGQGAASQTVGTAEAKGAPSMGEAIQMAAARKEMAKTEAETNLLNAQSIKEQKETKILDQQYDRNNTMNPLIAQQYDLANQHATHMNPQLWEQQRIANDFNNNLNPIRMRQEMEALTGAQLQNRIRSNETRLQEIGIRIQQFEETMRGVAANIAYTYGYTQAQADAYLKQVAVWMADNDMFRREWDDSIVTQQGSGFNVSEGGGVIGQIRQGVNTILNSRSYTRQERPTVPALPEQQQQRTTSRVPMGVRRSR